MLPEQSNAPAFWAVGTLWFMDDSLLLTTGLGARIIPKIKGDVLKRYLLKLYKQETDYILQAESRIEETLPEICTLLWLGGLFLNYSEQVSRNLLLIFFRLFIQYLLFFHQKYLLAKTDLLPPRFYLQTLEQSNYSPSAFGIWGKMYSAVLACFSMSSIIILNPFLQQHGWFVWGFF